MAARRAERSVAELAQHAGELDPAVEIGAGDVHAVAGQDVVLAVEPGYAFGRDAHDRKVRGTAADVGHKHGLLALRRAFEVERGGDRFVLEAQFGEADSSCSRGERRLRLRVARGIVIDEVHRTTEHGARNRRAALRLGKRLQVLQVTRDHVKILHPATAAEVGRLLDEARSEDAFHRAQQPAVEPVDVGRDGGAPEGARWAVCSVSVGQVEHGGRHRAVPGFELDQAHPAACVGNCDGRVGRAEIDRAVRVRSSGSAGQRGGAGRASSTRRPRGEVLLQQRGCHVERVARHTRSLRVRGVLAILHAVAG